MIMADGMHAHLRAARGCGEKTFGNGHVNELRFDSTYYIKARCVASRRV